MKKIPLTKNEYAVVDDEDFAYLMQRAWYCSSDGYAIRKAPWKVGEKRKIIHMHRVIINAKDGELVDHINHNKLDNRKINLRICTNQQNQHNSKISAKNSSGYKGVVWHKRDAAWQAAITFNNKRIHLGYHKSAEAAAHAYDDAARRFFGEYAETNF